jgi:hypothetical protein
MGAWQLVMSWDVGGTQGLIFPGLIGWVLCVVALLRATIRHRAAAALEIARDLAERRAVLWLWVACALFFAAAVGAEQFVSRWMPDSWRETLVKTFHVRRVYRNYGP